MILLQLFVIGVSCVFLSRVSSFLLLFYAILSLYTIVPQIGYIYFPELSVAMDAYFGQSIISSFQIFFLSNLIVVPLALYLSSKLKLSSGLAFRFSGFPGKSFFWLLYIFYFCSMWIIFIFNNQDINYATSSLSGGASIFIYLFPIMNKFGIGLAVLSYAYKDLSSYHRFLSFFVIGTIIFFAFKLGARVDLISLIIGIIFINLGTRRLYFRDFIKGVLIFPALVIVLLIIEANRNATDIIAMGLSIQDFIAKDYLGPGHTIFVLIYHNYINPVGQLISNIVNSFPGLSRILPGEFPLLSETVGGMISDGSIVISKSQGYAFHILGEGYVFMGMWGAIYNFVAILFNFSILQFFKNSLDPKSQTVFIALVVTLFFPLVRSQYSYFFEFYFIYLIPLMLLHFLFYSNTYKHLAGDNNGT